MRQSDHLNDSPISKPEHDKFGIDPFAQTIANSISAFQAPEGSVIAINGPWGSGKSSAINLILHHLKNEIDAERISVINFTCWWFRGEEALALAFFRELYAGLSTSAGDRFKLILPKLGARLLRAGSFLGAGSDLAGAAGAGSVAGAAADWLAGLVEQDETVEGLYEELRETLHVQEKKFLIVIDDIDRLSPDEALLIFRMVKSVGRLPNVIYLLVYDRQLAEKIVGERFPSEGPHYLEKIVQAAFELPNPQPEDLRNQLLAQVEQACFNEPPADIRRFMNVFYDVVAPLLLTPRDVGRIANVLSFTWPVVAGEVDAADFLAIEALRLCEPDIYRAIRGNKSKLIGTSDHRSGRVETLSDEYDRLLLASVSEDKRAQKREALMRLFPRLQSVWNNMFFGSDSVADWARERLICSPHHFDIYFRFSLGEETLSRSQITEFIERCTEAAFVESTMHDALENHRKDGSTKVALLLEELEIHASQFNDEDIQPFLSTLFSMADKLDVDTDKKRGFDIGSNNLRIHWLLRRLTLERFDLATRSAIFVAACEKASLAWLLEFSDSAYRDYHPLNGGDPQPERKCLTTSEHADQLRQQSLERVRAASESEELKANESLGYLLFAWKRLAEDGGEEVRAWTNSKLDEDEMIVMLSKAFTTETWSQGIGGLGGLGDTVAIRRNDANVSSIDQVVDRNRLRARVEELASREDFDPSRSQIVLDFLEAWNRYDNDPEQG